MFPWVPARYHILTIIIKQNMDNQIKKIASFIEALPVEGSAAECESVLLSGGALESVEDNSTYNGGDCNNTSYDCMKSYNSGNCKNMAGMCGEATNLKNCSCIVVLNPCNLGCGVE